MNKRLRIEIQGTVQGVGFRPFVFQCAQQFELTGWILNNSHGVQLEVEGAQWQLDQFCQTVHQHLPPLAHVSSFESRMIPCQQSEHFEIRASECLSEQRAQIAADNHVCDACLAELFDADDRRFGYPFINCTDCGPRYSIVTAVPYDRSTTTMAAFELCELCHQEYQNPASRRFHAQPNACAQCGPQLQLFDGQAQALTEVDPLTETIRRLQAGQIVAIKGLGGYHLVVDGCNDHAVQRLRRRKQRDDKPFAVMSASLEQAERYAQISNDEARLLQGPQRPIVLLSQLAHNSLSPYVAPGQATVGVMLPYTPLHHLLLRDQFVALVMTSGNRSDEPMAYRDDDARDQLQGIADAFLSHNRPIQMRVDDSIVRMMAGQSLLLRRSRGYVPQAISLPVDFPRDAPVTLALGGELKNTLCLIRGGQAFLSQHLGDLTQPSAYEAFCAANHHLQALLQVQPQQLACDLHPDYASRRFADSQTEPLVKIQHHHAHLASCLVENGICQPCIGVIFDGLGYGADGQLWGGEFLVGDLHGYQRLGHLDYVAMPGGDAATREPYRMALSYLHHSFGRQLPELEVLSQIPHDHRQLLLLMLDRQLNSPLTSSCGRLFDAVAVLLGGPQQVSYEGQAAVELEMLIDDSTAEGDRCYPFEFSRTTPFVCDVRPLIRAIVDDLGAGVASSQISRRFHNTLAQVIVAAAQRIRCQHGLECVALSGGVFQNRYLVETTLRLLQKENFQVYRHHLVPPNDGGLSLGQAAIASVAAIHPCA